MRPEKKTKSKRRRGCWKAVIWLASLLLLAGCGTSRPEESVKGQEAESEEQGNTIRSADAEETADGQESEDSLESEPVESSDPSEGSETSMEENAGSSEISEETEGTENSEENESSVSEGSSSEEASLSESGSSFEESSSEELPSEEGSSTSEEASSEETSSAEASSTEDLSSEEEFSFTETLVAADSSYRYEVFSAIADARVAAGLPTGSWNDALAESAQSFAEQLCAEKARYHAYDGLYAESVIQMYGSAYETGMMAYTHCSQLAEDAEMTIFGVGAATLYTEDGSFTVVVVRGSYEGEY